MIKKIIWGIKQLLPLKYDTVFEEAGRRKLCIWRMWMGRSFHIRYFTLADD